MTRTEREVIARNNILIKRLIAEGFKGEVYAYMYGSLKMISGDGRLLLAGEKTIKQLRNLKHTTKGDFCHLHSGRNEVR